MSGLKSILELLGEDGGGGGRKWLFLCVMLCFSVLPLLSSPSPPLPPSSSSLFTPSPPFLLLLPSLPCKILYGRELHCRMGSVLCGTQRCAGHKNLLVSARRTEKVTLNSTNGKLRLFFRLTQ